MKNSKLIYTPNGIPVGEPVVDENGNYYLRVKHGPRTDDIAITQIFYQTIKKLEKVK